MGIKFVLTDIDGTLTSVDSTGGMARSILKHFQDLAGSDVFPPSDICISKSLAKYNIEQEKFAEILRRDLAEHTVLRPDAAELLHWCAASGRKLYTATTNSKFISLLKLSLGGVKEEEFTGFFGGDAFNDPLGKKSPEFFPSILKSIGSDGKDVVMLGDEAKYDLYPALAAGVALVIMVDLKQKEDVCFKEGAYFVNSLCHARRIIENA